MNKLCLGCKHFLFTTGEHGYSEMTPGTDFSMECMKNHFKPSLDHGRDISNEEFARRINMATECKDFELARHAKQDGTLK